MDFGMETPGHLPARSQQHERLCSSTTVPRTALATDMVSRWSSCFLLTTMLTCCTIPGPSPFSRMTAVLHFHPSEANVHVPPGSTFDMGREFLPEQGFWR